MSFDLTNAPKVDATFQGLDLTIAQPIPNGHTCSANEAAALNQLFLENLRNNTRKAMVEILQKTCPKPSEPISEENPANPSPADVKACQDLLDEAAAKYEFGGTGGGGKKLSDLEQAEFDLVWPSIAKTIRAKGGKVQDYKMAEKRKMARRVIEKNPQVTEKAKKIVEAAKKNQVDLGDIEI